MAAITKYFVGGELEAFILGSRAGTTWTTAAGTYDPDFSRGAVIIPTGISVGDYINMPLTSPQLSCWVSFQSWRPVDATGAQNETWFHFINASLVPIYRVQGIGGSPTQPIVQFQYWNGSIWTAIGTGFVVPTGARNKWDFQLNSNAATGTLAAYVDGVLLGSVTGNTIFTTPSALAAVHHLSVGPGPSDSIAVSEGMIFDVSTLGRRLSTLGEVSNGINSDWIGSVTDINEVGTYDDSNFIETNAINQVSTFVNSQLTTVAQQYLVSGVIIAGRILIGTIGPQNLKGAVVVSGTTYYSSADVANLVTSFGYTWADFPQNPATSLDWTPAQVNAPIETGWKSLT